MTRKTFQEVKYVMLKLCEKRVAQRNFLHAKVKTSLCIHSPNDFEYIFLI